MVEALAGSIVATLSTLITEVCKFYKLVNKKIITLQQQKAE